jgi:hypothetical protein
MIISRTTTAELERKSTRAGIGLSLQLHSSLEKFKEIYGYLYIEI